MTRGSSSPSHERRHQDDEQVGVRQGCTYVGAWITATTAAVVLSWFGVRDVLHDAMLDHVQPLPLPSGSEHPAPAPTTSEPSGTSTPRTTQETSKPPTGKSPTGDPPSGRPGPPATSTDPRATSDADAKRVRGYHLAGGRVVLAMYPDHVRLLSAVPNPGHEVKTWRNDQWLRVDMVGTGERSSLFATWNGHPPTVRVVEY